MTHTQRRVLQLLADGLDLVYSKGRGWWVGDEQTNGKLAQALIRLMFVRPDSYNQKVERYTINESGRRALAGEKPYCDGRGRYFGTLEEVMVANRE